MEASSDVRTYVSVCAHRWAPKDSSYASNRGRCGQEQASSGHRSMCVHKYVDRFGGP